MKKVKNAEIMRFCFLIVIPIVLSSRMSSGLNVVLNDVEKYIAHFLAQEGKILNVVRQASYHSKSYEFRNLPSFDFLIVEKNILKNTLKFLYFLEISWICLKNLIALLV